LTFSAGRAGPQPRDPRPVPEFYREVVQVPVHELARRSGRKMGRELQVHSVFAIGPKAMVLE
jgi:hypothetical protein